MDRYVDPNTVEEENEQESIGKLQKLVELVDNNKKSNRAMKIVFYTAGGTIDKIYFDSKSAYEVGESTLDEILKEGNISFEYENRVIVRKDSLELTDTDRDLIYRTIEKEPQRMIVLTHGTDTMVKTAQRLWTIRNKVVVLTGSLAPARFRNSDAAFNIACAATAVQILSDGIYIAMNGRIFTPDRVRKNVTKGMFEEVSPDSTAAVSFE